VLLVAIARARLLGAQCLDGGAVVYAMMSMLCMRGRVVSREGAMGVLLFNCGCFAQGDVR